MKDQHGCIVPRVTCDGVDANAEQLKRGMTSVYRIYGHDLNLYVLQHDAKVAKRGWLVPHASISPYPFRGAQSKA
jgi:micrococcal nuclease